MREHTRKMIVQDLIKRLSEKAKEDVERKRNPLHDRRKRPERLNTTFTSTKEELSSAAALNAVRRYGRHLRYVKDQTEEICLHAVKQDGYALKFVKNQTKEICLAAVKKEGYALKFVKNQTKEICLAAVKEDGYSLKFVASSFFLK